jgi:ribosomal protein L23
VQAKIDCEEIKKDKLEQKIELKVALQKLYKEKSKKINLNNFKEKAEKLFK